MSAGLSAAYFICPLDRLGPGAAPLRLSRHLHGGPRRAGHRLPPVLAFGAQARSFGGFCESMFVVGAGLATPETAAGPFLAICGARRATPRSGSTWLRPYMGFGSFAAPFVGSQLFFASDVGTDEGLRTAQWVYLGTAAFVGLLIVLFFLAPMLTCSSKRLKLASRTRVRCARSSSFFLQNGRSFATLEYRLQWRNYFIQFCVSSGTTKARGAELFALGQGLYALNRFVAGGLMTIPAVKPRYILALYLGMRYIFIALAMNTRGPVSITMLILILCFESACFPTIFMPELRGLGRHTKIGGSLFAAAISGGMVFPPMAGAAMDESGAHMAMAVPMVEHILAWTSPLYVNGWNREVMDIYRETTYGLELLGDKDVQLDNRGAH
ncbi:hypothetical protein PpBr36_08297 [Pyricularia pennisetigena]|uniref:hypothetical protein n=1 Tax=Pyricularia pennisetigena TaxID=1578925 RepID=UPI001152C38D|nr:hypothetical protein PpBr36_08297 [Pyricularia pennisetigena]TLS24602.1 hypothetical protein PpBr36_08297 [Pyricularia pennisetigena]